MARKEGRWLAGENQDICQDVNESRPIEGARFVKLREIICGGDADAAS